MCPELGSVRTVELFIERKFVSRELAEKKYKTKRRNKNGQISG